MDTSHSNRRGWIVLAAALAAAGLFVYAGEQWQDQRQEHQVDQLIDSLCATTPDC